MVNKLNKAFYNTILSQALSPCGNYLVVGDIYGVLSVFHLSKIIHPDTNLSPDELKAKNSITVKDGFQINSLASTETDLLVGGVGTIYAYPWKNIKTNKNVNASWTIEVPNTADSFDKVDVNCLLVNNDNNLLYAGCGDNIVYVFDIETRRVMKTLNSHKDYIHTLSRFNNDLISGGEDGLVNIWDCRSGKVVNTIEPFKDDKINRPDLGKWIGAVDCNEDYILSGGGPRLSLWHLRFLTNSTVFPIEDSGIHVAEINGDKVFAGGRCPIFYQMSFNGDILCEIQTAAVTTYSIAHQEEPFKCLSIAGSSPKIDLCSNFMYRDQQLSLY